LHQPDCQDKSGCAGFLYLREEEAGFHTLLLTSHFLRLTVSYNQPLRRFETDYSPVKPDIYNNEHKNKEGKYFSMSPEKYSRYYAHQRKCP
jgi:hypothetical protein